MFCIFSSYPVGYIRLWMLYLIILFLGFSGDCVPSKLLSVCDSRLDNLHYTVYWFIHYYCRVAMASPVYSVALHVADSRGGSVCLEYLM